MVLGALAAVDIADAIAADDRVLAHVDGPDVGRVAGQEAVEAVLDAVGPDEVVAAAAVVGVGVAAHDSPRKQSKIVREGGDVTEPMYAF